MATRVIGAYKATLSPFFAGSCRFEPSCSTYAREAIETHGWGGFSLAASRLARCRPFGGNGFDPVPAGDSTGGGLAKENK